MAKAVRCNLEPGERSSYAIPENSPLPPERNAGAIPAHSPEPALDDSKRMAYHGPVQHDSTISNAQAS